MSKQISLKCQIFVLSEHHSITLDSETYKMIVIGHSSLIDGINSGEIKFDGEVSEIEEMLDYFDPFTINTDSIRG